MNNLPPIVFVTGKGGVGKSTVAAALATSLARAGKKTLLVEFSAPSFFSLVYKRPVHFEPTELRTHLWLSLWSGEHCLREFLLHYVRFNRVVDLFFENRVMKTFVQAAPALKELALLGKATSGPRQVGPTIDYDHLVIDAPATGHFEALIKVPEGMSQAVKFGPMGEQSRDIHKVLIDPQCTKIFIVTLLEELPVSETLELHASLAKNLKGQQAEVLVNRYLQMDLEQNQLNELSQRHSEAQAFIQYLQQIQKKQSGGLAKLSDLSPQKMIPLIPETDPVAKIEKMAELFQ